MDTQLYRSPQRSRGGITVGYKTDKGLKRAGNEDNHAVFTGAELNARLDAFLVVADGMGGTKGGEIASALVINSLPEAVQAFLAERSRDDFTGSPEAVAALLKYSMTQANATVWAYKQQHTGLEQMGTTCVTAVISQGMLTIGNVGDSRAYLLRGGKLSQITDDHSSVWEEVQAGRMTREQAASSRYRNVITRAMGLEPSLRPDVDSQSLQDGDAVLLCSDGLTTEVDDQTLARLLAASADPQQACDRLVAEALRNGGSDNITVVALHYGGFVPLTASPTTPLVAGVDEDEDVTDPNQAWKRSLTASPSSAISSNRASRSSASARSSSLAPEVDEDADRYARDSFEDASVIARSGVSPLLVGLLVLTALAEAIGLYLFWSGQIKPRYDSKINAPTQTMDAKPTDKPLTYKNPVAIYTKPNLWEGVLQVMPDGRLLVVDSKNHEFAVTSGGTVDPLPQTDIRVPALLRPTLRGDKTLKPVPIYPAIAIDASGYRYELNTGTKAIDKYDLSGTPLLTDIGKGKLRAPANLAVDKRGNLYVIDGNQLKLIEAIPDTGEAASSTRSGAANHADTPPAATGQGSADGTAGKAIGASQ
jgi:serine/threonine protein phosphatase PrpC